MEVIKKSSFSKPLRENQLSGLKKIRITRALYKEKMSIQSIAPSIFLFDGLVFVCKILHKGIVLQRRVFHTFHGNSKRIVYFHSIV